MLDILYDNQKEEVEAMKYFTAQEVGRTFIVRLERGDYLREAIIDMIQKEGIQNGIVTSGIATFDEVNIRMANTYGFPIKYDTHHLREPLELANLDGTIINQEPHLHGTVGNGEHTWAGHLMDECRILYLAEIVIQEVKGANLTRKPDQDGVQLIDQM